MRRLQFLGLTPGSIYTWWFLHLDTSERRLSFKMVIITDSEPTLEDTSSSTLGRDVSKESSDSLTCGPEEENVKLFSKQLLQNKLFVGHYQERRLVEFIGTYRDVVVVDKSEVDLKRDLDSVRSRLSNFYYNIWIGITGPHMVGAPPVIAVWVKLQNLPFGHYWFQIKQVQFKEREIYLRLKMIRPLALNDPVNEGVQQLTKTASQQSLVSSCSSSCSAATAASVNGLETDWTESMLKWRNTIMEQFLTNFTAYATLHNVKQSVCFVTAMFMTAITGMIYGVQFAGDFCIKFMREASMFLQASTPIILGVIEFFSKMVGGLYLLLAMMWRGGTVPEEVPPARPALRSPYIPPYTPPYPYRALPMPPPSLQRTSSTSKKL